MLNMLMSTIMDEGDIINGKSIDCPHPYPREDDLKSVQDNFNPASYELNLNKNRE